MALRGILPIVATPFGSEGELDESALARVVDFCLDCGAHGLVWPAVASEFYALSEEERRRGVRVVLGAAAGRVPFVAGVAASSSQLAAALTEDAITAGASAVMTLPPYVVKESAAGVRRYFKSICEAAQGRDVILQNAPPPLGQGFPPQVVLALVEETPGITYVKEETVTSGHALSSILAQPPSRLQGVFGGGGGRAIIEEYHRGACGAMPACEYTDVFVTLWDVLEDRRLDEARALFERVLPLLSMQAVLRMAFTKAVLARRGVLDSQVVRISGGLELDETDRAELEALSTRIVGDLRV